MQYIKIINYNQGSNTTSKFRLWFINAKKYKKSGIKYIAITNHDKILFNIDKNINIDMIGDFYPNNMFMEPFNFKNPIKDVKDIINNKNLEKGLGNLIIFDIQEQNI